MSNHERKGSRTPAGDDALDHAWQQLSDEQPPPALDAAIIAAAHKSIQGRDQQAQVVRASRPSRSWLTRWQPLAAAAAVAGLAFVLVQSLPRDRDVAPSLRMEEPATTPAAADTATTMRATEADQRQLATPDMAGRAASAAPAAPVPEQRTEAPAATATAEAPARDNVAPPNAADLAARVAALYAAGDVVGAAAALREFRAVDPDADTYLPESLRDWARTVP
jgi:resuscitation-promoting factor RpfA